jgi:hypothetical protein
MLLHWDAYNQIVADRVSGATAGLSLRCYQIGNTQRHWLGKDTTMYVINDGRLLGFDFGDWSLLLTGLALTALLALAI